MDRILIIMKNNGPRASSAPLLGYFPKYSNMFIGIYNRSQVSVYRNIGPAPKHRLWVFVLRRF